MNLAVIINGKKELKITSEQNVLINEILNDDATHYHVKHKLICELLRIPRCVPAEYYKPYAVKETNIKFYYFEDGCTRELGGGFKCYNCKFKLTLKPSGVTCPACQCPTLPNFNPELNKLHDS